MITAFRHLAESRLPVSYYCSTKPLNAFLFSSTEASDLKGNSLNFLKISNRFLTSSMDVPSSKLCTTSSLRFRFLLSKLSNSLVMSLASLTTTAGTLAILNEPDHCNKKIGNACIRNELEDRYVMTYYVRCSTHLIQKRQAVCSIGRSMSRHMTIGYRWLTFLQRCQLMKMSRKDRHASNPLIIYCDIALAKPYPS